MLSSAFKFREADSAPVLSDVSRVRKTDVSPRDGWSSTPGQEVVFDIVPSPTEWLSTRLFLSFFFRVTNANGSVLAPAADVAPINLIGLNMWSMMNLDLNERTVEGRKGNGGLANYVSTVLGLSLAEKNNIAAELLVWSPDEPSRYQSKNDAENPGYATRKLLASGSAWIRVLMPLPFGVCSSGLSYPPNTRVRVTLTNASNDFRLITDDANPTYIVQLAELKVHADFLMPSPSLNVRLEARLRTEGGLSYDYVKKVATQATTISAGTQAASVVLCSGITPDLVIVVCQPDRLTRNMSRNPLDFSNNGVKELQIQAGGTMHPTIPLSYDWTTGKGCQESYAALVNAAKTSFGGDGSIGYAAFTGGMTYFCISLANWLPSRSYDMIRETGETSLRISFAAPLPAALNVSAILVGNTSMRIDALGSVQLNPFPA